MNERSNEEVLKEQYKAALDEWYASGDAELWETVIGDGLDAEDDELGYRLPDRSFAGNEFTPEAQGIHMAWAEIRELANERQPPESWR